VTKQIEEEWEVVKTTVEPTKTNESPYPIIHWMLTDSPKILPEPENHAKRDTFRGFYAKCGQNEEFDAALERVGVRRETLRFNDGNTAKAWIFGEAMEVIVLSRGIHHVKDSNFDIYTLLRGNPLQRFGIAMGWTPRREDGNYVFNEKGNPRMGGTFVNIAVMIRRVQAGNKFVTLTDEYTAPVILAFKGMHATDEATLALQEWRDAIVDSKIKGDSELFSALKKGVIAQLNEYEQLGGAPLRKNLPLYCMSIPFGFVGVRDSKPSANKEKDSSAAKEVNVPGFMAVPRTLTPEWVQARVITGTERFNVETRLDEVEEWALRESVARIWPHDLKVQGKTRDGEDVPDLSPDEGPQAAPVADTPW
jgi:hypothetical protein